jgi:hypothetical protein
MKCQLLLIGYHPAMLIKFLPWLSYFRQFIPPLMLFDSYATWASHSIVLLRAGLPTELIVRPSRSQPTAASFSLIQLQLPLAPCQQMRPCNLHRNRQPSYMAPIVCTMACNSLALQLPSYTLLHAAHSMQTCNACGTADLWCQSYAQQHATAAMQ